jgi:hypothetical protein
LVDALRSLASSPGAHPEARARDTTQNNEAVNERSMGPNKAGLFRCGKWEFDWIHARYIVENCGESRVLWRRG